VRISSAGAVKTCSSQFYLTGSITGCAKRLTRAMFLERRFPRTVSKVTNCKNTRPWRPKNPTWCVSPPRGFVTKHSFKEHMVTHTGERPYKCQSKTACNATFKSSANQHRHFRESHRDEYFAKLSKKLLASKLLTKIHTFCNQTCPVFNYNF